jgi:septal ring factor EnvC (AmiA/AmiB activator)
VPPDAVPDDAPALVGDVRNLRRWLWVAGVWAVAASAIAIIALLKANENSQPKTPPSAVTASQLTGVQHSLDQRIKALETQLKDVPTSSDVAKLDSRLKAVEKKADGTASDVKAVRKDLDNLTSRVQKVEQKQKQQSSSNGGTSANTNTTTTP